MKRFELMLSARDCDRDIATDAARTEAQDPGSHAGSWASLSRGTIRGLAVWRTGSVGEPESKRSVCVSGG